MLREKIYMLSVQLYRVIARNSERELYRLCERVYSVLNGFRVGVDGVSVRVYSVLNEFRVGVDGVSVRERC